MKGMANLNLWMSPLLSPGRSSGTGRLYNISTMCWCLRKAAGLHRGKLGISQQRYTRSTSWLYIYTTPETIIQSEVNTLLLTMLTPR